LSESPSRSVSQARLVEPVPPAVSERIAIARVLCIFFMTFVHVQPGIAENVYDREAGIFDVVYFTLTRLVGLSSVSLLGIVSGYFIVASLMKAGAGGVIRSKLRTLLVPLVAWNGLMLVLIVAYGALSGNWRDLPDASALGVANAFLALTEWPLVVPLWFLRDLFVCCLLSPLLLVGLRRAPLIIALVLAAYALFGDGLYLMQRPALLLFFALGMWLRLGAVSPATIDRAATILLAGLAVMVAVFLTIRIERILIADMNDQLRIALDTGLRVTMAAGFWWLTSLVRRSGLRDHVLRLEPYAFFLFCSHAILFNFGGIVLRRIFGNYGDPLFAVSFFLQPLLAVVAAVAGLWIVSRMPVLPVLLNAGRRVGSGLPAGKAAAGTGPAHRGAG
jgi:hypothetical protein